MIPHTTNGRHETTPPTTPAPGICYACQRPRPTTRGIDGERYCDDCLVAYAKEATQ